MSKIRVAIAGVGNLAAGLIQALYYYRSPENEEKLQHRNLGGYLPEDIDLVAAFDIDERKVGNDVTMIVNEPELHIKRFVSVDELHVPIQRGPTYDGISEMAASVVKESSEPVVDVAKVLRENNVDMLIIATPTGAVEAANFYANEALQEGIAVINTTPTPLIRNPALSKKFREKRVPLIGDDLQSKGGGTAIHKAILEALNNEGIKVIDTYQLDVSGGLEGLSTLDPERRQYKRDVKENTISRDLPYHVNVASGTTDYLDFLGDRRIGHFWIYGQNTFGAPVKMDIRLVTYDSSSAAGALLDVIRATKIAQNLVMGGPILPIAAKYFKAPPVYYSRKKADQVFKEFIGTL